MVKEKKGKSVRFAYNEETGGPVTDSRVSDRWIEDLWSAPGAGEESWVAKECECGQGVCFCDEEEWEGEMNEEAKKVWRGQRGEIQQLMKEKIWEEYGGEEVAEEAAAEEEVVVEQVVEEVERLSISEGDAGEEEDGGGEQQKPADDLDSVFAFHMAGKFDDESDDEDEGYGGGGDAGEDSGGGDGAVEDAGGGGAVEDAGGGDGAVEDEGYAGDEDWGGGGGLGGDENDEESECEMF